MTRPRAPMPLVAPIALGLAVVAFVIAVVGEPDDRSFLATPAIAVAVVSLVVGAFGVRSAVRVDRGLPLCLFAVAIGFVALVLGVFRLGADNGGSSLGERPPPAVQHLG